MSTSRTTDDPIDYSRPFAEHVKGQLYAKFQTNVRGEPEYEEDEDGLRHYTIDVYLASPRADEIDEVRYIMEDPTYYDPIGYSSDAANDFHEEVQSYGEVPVSVEVRIGDKVYKQRAYLSSMLANGYSQNQSESVKDAIRRIRVN